MAVKSSSAAAATDLLLLLQSDVAQTKVQEDGRAGFEQAWLAGTEAPGRVEASNRLAQRTRRGRDFKQASSKHQERLKL